eukprot:CAMPEP_0176370576 /NCGR_PEP_ID=MMETSP0126-20121128/24088_1 /TAXON_ID=141414 ORGANISM="Strombidinopsis acuminatum, Strain SPMC142" /NCGR_SAMPLE_ID=MMETSP0126 /ASSEMBLY_ACC=CAM_ASM_000229 /LENGTH=98 /DNA_ID=CAMNT_0017729675 /DNA_START=697 /DNA_END=993 /DNA_ORIENTATION=-
MRAHSNDIEINDAKFSPIDPNLIITSANDGNFKIWDIRDNGYKYNLMGTASDDSLNCSAFNPINRYVFATAGESTGMIGIWDMRMPEMFTNDLIFHQK